MLNIQKRILQIFDFFKPKSQKLSDDHILFQEYAPFKMMSIKTGFFLSVTFCCTPISGIIDHYYIMENQNKNWEKIRTN